MSMISIDRFSHSSGICENLLQPFEEQGIQQEKYHAVKDPGQDHGMYPPEVQLREAAP